MSNQSLKRKKRLRKKRITLIVEVIILLVLAVAALGTGWVRNKLGMINYQSLDDARLITATEANGGIAVEEIDLEGKEMFALVGIDTREGAGGDNSDTMIIAYIDHDNKSIKLVSLYRDTYLNIGDDYYFKCNAAYAKGGPIQMLNMMNANLDLDLTQYISVQFGAVVDVVDILGGVDVDLCREEIEILNGLNNETSRVTGHEYVLLDVPSEESLPDGEYRTTHLDGAQALSYARIRFTAGNDFRRTARQRLLLSLILQKAKEADLATQNEILNKVLPQVETNADPSKLISLARPLLSYEIEASVGFPFDHFEDRGNLTGLDCVLPATLESNVRLLHKFLFNSDTYQPSATMRSISDYIINETGITEEDAPEKSEDGSLPWLVQDDPLADLETASSTDQGSNASDGEDSYDEEEAYTDDGSWEESEDDGSYDEDQDAY